MNINLVHVSFQYIRASKNGIPVCPEKKRSPPNENLLINIESIIVCEGKGATCVKLMNIDLVITNNAKLFIAKGILCGLCKKTTTIHIIKIIDPYIKVLSKSNTLMFESIMSVTGLLMLLVA